MQPGTYSTDNEGRILSTNTQFLKILGLNSDIPLSGKKIGELKYFKFYPRFELKKQAQWKEKMEDIPVTLVSHNGNRVPVLETIQIKQSSQGLIYECQVYPLEKIDHGVMTNSSFGKEILPASIA